jgi:hypothetical protein
MSIKVFGEDYSLVGPNTPLKLNINKTLGFSLAYCDNDELDIRENFMGSVNTQGHIDNLGYQDASVFGTLQLMESVLVPIQSRKANYLPKVQETALFGANGSQRKTTWAIPGLVH